MLNLKSSFLTHIQTHIKKNFIIIIIFWLQKAYSTTAICFGEKALRDSNSFFVLFCFFLESNFSHAIGFQKIPLDFCKTEMDWQVADYCFTL